MLPHPRHLGALLRGSAGARCRKLGFLVQRALQLRLLGPHCLKQRHEFLRALAEGAAFLCHCAQLFAQPRVLSCRAPPLKLPPLPLGGGSAPPGLLRGAFRLLALSFGLGELRAGLQSQLLPAGRTLRLPRLLGELSPKPPDRGGLLLQPSRTLQVKFPLLPIPATLCLQLFSGALLNLLAEMNALLPLRALALELLRVPGAQVLQLLRVLRAQRSQRCLQLRALVARRRQHRMALCVLVSLHDQR
mmetsp:Transcript_95478/g.303053  ORF Transcript_95478/g.303053 Transcript_95478/m.303053 type:complete len:246 (+) Transcript_95478:752-1489(+)